MFGGQDEEGRYIAQVAALHGHLIDLSEPDVLDQADKISALTLAIAARLQRDGDTVLALADAYWFTPFDSVSIATASKALLDRVVARLCDRLAYLLGEYVRLVEPRDTEPPVKKALRAPIRQSGAHSYRMRPETSL